MSSPSLQDRADTTSRSIFLVLFLAGILVHLAYVFSLMQITPMDEWNWESGDTRSYLIPAESFLQEGAFLNKGVPDYRRTVGYPLFLAGVIKVADIVQADLRVTIYVIQAIVYAAAYPAIYFLGVTLFGLRHKVALICVACTMFSGAFVSYVTMILSDALFATVLVVGVACGFFALKKQKWIWAATYVLFIVYAANVRPMLAFFPFAMLLLHLVWLKGEGVVVKQKIWGLLLLMFTFSLLGVQTPALRNWVHYKVFTPTEIGSINLFRYLGKDVLNYTGESERYVATFEELQSIDQPDKLRERIKIRKSEAIKIFTDYPIETFGALVYNIVLNSTEMHWQNFFFLQKQTWYQDYADGSVVWSPIPFLAAMLFICFYGAVYLTILLSAFLWKRNTLLIFSLLIFLIPYGFSGTSYQGARFRLWLEPFMLMLFFSILQKLVFSIPVVRNQKIAANDS